MNAQDVILTVVVGASGGWFLARNRKALSRSEVARHVIFIGFVWAGCVAMFHGDALVRWVFGRDIYKGETKETAAVAVRLGSILLSFAAAALSLGKDRVRQFKLYGETFAVNRLRRPR